MSYSVLNDYSQTFDIGQNTMLKIKPGYDIISVDTISIDEFMRMYKIPRIDFIKADIEGSERDMLRGARDALAHFSPKLALCTYHLPDDPEVMEKLILDANPNYIIEHKWKKLYAYCP